jgi:hypothetical protein
MNHCPRAITSFTLAAIAGLTTLAHAGPTVFTAAGLTPADIQGTVTAFNSAISLGGANNGVAGGPHLFGRREVNWDAPGLDAFQSPGVMPDNFFNNNSKRGAVFNAPVGDLLVSKRVTDGNARFGDIEPSYATSFKTFSPQRLFGVRGGTQVDSTFFIPNATTQAASVNGFGVVFTDVDVLGSTSIEFFDAGNTLLHRVVAPVADGGLSFAAVFFATGERISSVRITSGNAPLGAGSLDSGDIDVVAMDDFFYSEPQIPAPASLSLLAISLCAFRRRR